MTNPKLSDSLNTHINYLISENNNSLSHISTAAKSAFFTNIMINLYNKHLDRASTIDYSSAKILCLANLMKNSNISQTDCTKYFSTTTQSLPDNLDEILNAVYNPNMSGAKNIYRKIIEDASRFESIEKTKAFDGKSLELYQDLRHKDATVSNDIGHIMMSSRYLFSALEHDSDASAFFANPANKFSDEDVNLATLKFLYADGHLIEPNSLRNTALYFESKYDPSKPLTKENLCAAIDEDRVFLRAIMRPAKYSAETEPIGRRLYEGKKSDEERQVLLRGRRDFFGELEKRREKRHETGAEIEFRKIMREPGVPTLAKESKIDRTSKHGNPSRPCTKADYGAQLFEDVGYGIVKNSHNELFQDISKVSCGSLDSGFGKMTTQVTKDTSVVVKQKLETLGEFLKTGAGDTEFNEILMDIRKEDVGFIFYYNGDTYRKGAENPFQKELLAIYLKESFKKQAHKSAKRLFDYIKETGETSLNEKLKDYINLSHKDLPIFEYNQNALYPREKVYNNSQILELCKMDFLEFAKEHFQVMNEYPNLGDMRKDTFLSNADAVSKYMDNEYIKIHRPKLRQEIFKSSQEIITHSLQSYLNESDNRKNLTFNSILALNDLSGGLLLHNHTMKVPELTSIACDNFATALNNKKSVSKYDMKGIAVIVESEHRKNITNATTLNKLSEICGNLLEEKFIQQDGNGIKVCLNNFSPYFSDLIKINFELGTGSSKEISKAIREGRCHFENDGVEQWPDKDGIIKTSMQIYDLMRYSGLRNSELETTFLKAFTEFIDRIILKGFPQSKTKALTDCYEEVLSNRSIDARYRGIVMSDLVTREFVKKDAVTRDIVTKDLVKVDFESITPTKVLEHHMPIVHQPHLVRNRISPMNFIYANTEKTRAFSSLRKVRLMSF